MSPRSDHGQKVVSFDIRTDPRSEVTSVMDTFGNEHHVFDIHGSHESLKIVGQSVIEKQSTDPIPFDSKVSDWNTMQSWENSWELWNFMEPSRRTKPTKTFLAWLDGCQTSNADSPFQRLRQAERFIHENIEYRKNVTDVRTPIDKVIDLRAGVCQDFAHLLLAATRFWGIPSRYVSGYLGNGMNLGSVTPNESHAWVECYLPHGGWIALDPTNPSQSTDDRIVIAIGRDYEDVSPSRGVTFGKDQIDSELFVDVKVKIESIS